MACVLLDNVGIAPIVGTFFLLLLLTMDCMRVTAAMKQTMCKQLLAFAGSSDILRFFRFGKAGGWRRLSRNFQLCKTCLSNSPLLKRILASYFMMRRVYGSIGIVMLLCTHVRTYYNVQFAGHTDFTFYILERQFNIRMSSLIRF